MVDLVTVVLECARVYKVDHALEVHRPWTHAHGPKAHGSVHTYVQVTLPIEARFGHSVSRGASRRTPNIPKLPRGGGVGVVLGRAPYEHGYSYT